MIFVSLSCIVENQLRQKNKSLTFLPSTTGNEGELTSEQDETNSNSFFSKAQEYTPKKIGVIILAVIIIICLYQAVIFFSSTSL